MTILDANILINFSEFEFVLIILEGRADGLEDHFFLRNIELSIQLFLNSCTYQVIVQLPFHSHLLSCILSEWLLLNRRRYNLISSKLTRITRIRGVHGLVIGLALLYSWEVFDPYGNRKETTFISCRLLNNTNLWHVGYFMVKVNGSRHLSSKMIQLLKLGLLKQILDTLLSL